MSPVFIEELFDKCKPGMNEILNKVNLYNDILYDWIIPRLFYKLYDLTEFEHKTEEEIELVKIPKEGYYWVSGEPERVVHRSDMEKDKLAHKSFHLDTYCFDSMPEIKFFKEVLDFDKIREIYFTGMLTHGQSDFYINYIDPDTKNVRKYYPDFLIGYKDGSWDIIEIKADYKMDDPVVLAKTEYASQLAQDKFSYRIIAASDILRHDSKVVFSDRYNVKDGSLISL